MGRVTFLLLLIATTTHGQLFEFGSKKNVECNLLDSSPFFRDGPQRFQSQQILFLTEFSRFMNRQAQSILENFVNKKKIYHIQRDLSQVSSSVFKSHDEDESDPGSIPMLDKRINSTRQVLDVAKEALSAIEDAIDQSPPFASPEFWESACRSLWWPFNDKTCIQMRCTACSSAVLSAGAVCDLISQSKSHRCLQRVMGEGFCNFCIVEYLDQ